MRSVMVNMVTELKIPDTRDFNVQSSMKTNVYLLNYRDKQTWESLVIWSASQTTFK